MPYICSAKISYIGLNMFILVYTMLYRVLLS